VNGDPARYTTPAALRAALEDRLRHRAQDTGVPLDRLRKEVAHQRLLARLAAVAPEGAWVLKGGQALLARLDDAARATKDADTTWRASRDALREVIEAAGDCDLDDGFAFEVAVPEPLVAETEQGGMRYPGLALLDGREFERLQLDVNVAPHDTRPVENLRLRDLLGFAGIEPPEVPVIPPSQHLAEKLHAYTRRYASGMSSRPRDLFDMLLIARLIPLPPASAIVDAGRGTFELRETTWPPALQPPPPIWVSQWSAYVRDHVLPWATLDHAAAALAEFWQPLLADQLALGSVWDAEAWAWSAP